jgi:RNA polymerase sigma factor (sigma-70 family)
MTDDEFCELYEAHARRLWAYVFRATRNSSTADDIVQEAFLRVFAASSLERADANHRRNYLYTVATNLIRRRPRDEQLAEDAEPAGGPDSLDDKLDVESALGELSIVERQTLWLGYVERWSHREIAGMLGYTEGSLRQVAVRAKRRFLEVFNRKPRSGSGA